jgi:CRP-like cAMP-binding protein
MMGDSVLFTGLSKPECMEIASSARSRTFACDELMYSEGDPAQNMVQIYTGSAKISRLSPNGNEVILWMAGPGDPVGVLADSLTHSYTCSARAMEQSTALVWEYTRLQTVLVKYPRIGRNFGQILSTRLSDLQERFCEVSTEQVAKRLAFALLRLLKQVGKPAHGGIEISLTREELAQMTGTTLFTISRVLSRWGEEGSVLPRREAIVVLDVDLLAKKCRVGGLGIGKQKQPRESVPHVSRLKPGKSRAKIVHEPSHTIQ